MGRGRFANGIGAFKSLAGSAMAVLLLCSSAPALGISDAQARAAGPIDLVSLGRPRFQIYTDKEGLPQNVVECVTFDSKGFLWIGTQNGAAFYDARKWTVVNMPGRTVSNYVFAILAASDGSMWFGTQLAGLARLKDGKWETFNTANSGLPHNEVRSLLEVRDATGGSALWIGTGGGGVVKWEAGKWTRYSTANGALHSDVVRGLALTRSAAGAPTLWVATLGGGLSRFENGKWQTFDPGNSGLPISQIRCLMADAGPSDQPLLWIGTTGGGLVRYAAGRWNTFNAANTGLPINVVRSLGRTVSAKGQLIVWVGTNGNGLAYLDDGHWGLYDTRNSDLPNNAVLSLQSESQRTGSQSLWIGTLDGGVAHYVPGGWQTLDVRNSGLPDNQVWSLLQSHTDDGRPCFWFGTSHGLGRFEDGMWSVFSAGNSGLPSEYILSLAETGGTTQGHALWVGTNGGGLARLQAGKWQTFHAGNSGLPGNGIITMLPSAIPSADALWIGTDDAGLARYENGRWTVFDTSNSGLPNNKVLSLLSTPTPSGQEILWIGTQGGLARYFAGEWTRFDTGNSALPNNQVWGLQETVSASGRRYLWVGTVGGGAARLNPDSPRDPWLVLSDATVPALPNNSVWQIRQGRKGEIYLYTDRGIARLTPRMPTGDDPAEYSLYSFAIADGLPSNGCNQGAALLDREGRLWAGTGSGAAVFDPAAHVESAGSKPLYIEHTRINGKEVDMPGRVSLPYNQNNFEFNYALLSYFREASTQYRYQLAGFDPQPSAWTVEAKKEYTNLGEGEYVFYCWARDYAGNVSGPVAQAFAIRAAPWRTWFAYAIYGLTMLAAVVTTDRIQRRRLIRRERDRAQLREAELRAETAEAQAKVIEAENRRKSEELNFARQLQLSMLPKQNIFLDRVEIVGQMRTATEVGGDYYDFIKIDDQRFCVAIGDATGHGVGAGLVVGMVKTALLNSVLLMRPDSTVQELMRDLNVTLKASLTHRGVGMCLGIALVDLSRMSVEACFTGMPFPCRYDAASGSVQAMEMAGPPLGFMKQISPRSLRVSLAPGDRLVLLSDGFHERMDPAGVCWGYETVARHVAQICAANAGAGEIAGRLIADCDQFAAGRESDDDMTVVVIAAKTEATRP